MNDLNKADDSKAGDELKITDNKVHNQDKVSSHPTVPISHHSFLQLHNMKRAEKHSLSHIYMYMYI